MGVEGIEGRVEPGMLENEVFPVGTVGGGWVDMADDSSHGGKDLVLGPTPSVPFDGEKVEPFMKLETVVAHAPEGTG